MDPFSAVNSISPTSASQTAELLAASGNPSAAPSSETADLLSASGDPLAASFTDLINGLLTPGIPPSSGSGPSEAQILAQQANEEFLRKLALLSGMMEQAQRAMDAQKPLPGGLPTPAASEYYFVKSQLAQVGLPGEVTGVV